MKPRRRLTALLILGAVFLLGASDCDGTTVVRIPRPPVVEGLADIHVHQFAHLGFGGRMFTHDIEPHSPCREPLGYSDITMTVRDLVRHGLLEEANRQHGYSACYPTFSNQAAQQVDTTNLKRAWEYGLRLMVTHAVHSEFLCKVAELAADCNDTRALDAQLQAAYDLQDRIDAAAGGPGRGWYRVVTTPQDARAVIAEGKLAVVLGVESADAFGCGARVTGETPGVKPILSLDDRPFNIEKTYSSLCPEPVPPGFEGIWDQMALAKFEHFWNQGARHFFPVHTADSIAGGTALSTPLLHANNNPSGLTPKDVLFRGESIDSTIRRVRPQFNTWDCSDMDFDRATPDGPGSCNSRGLTAAGRALVDMMASYGAVIDIDHMSLRTKGDLFEHLGTWYGFTASHAGAHEINHGEKRNEGQLLPSTITALAEYQGAFGIILRPANEPEQSDTYPPGATARYDCGGTTEAFIQTYRYFAEQVAATELKTGFVYEPDPVRPVGIAFGSDFNGLAGWPKPRFIDPHPVHEKDAAGCQLQTQPGAEPGTIYPFTSPLTGQQFGRSTLPWNPNRALDINTLGVIHIGMLPDMVEDMRAQGLSETELKPLWHGAEQYLRAWEHNISASENNKGPEITNGIRESCRAERARLLAGGNTIDILRTLRTLGCVSS